jgi:hypothetical protein
MVNGHCKSAARRRRPPLPQRLSQGELSVVVAVAFVGMVQVVAYQEVGVVAGQPISYHLDGTPLKAGFTAGFSTPA